MIREKQFHMNHALHAQQNNRSLFIGFTGIYSLKRCRVLSILRLHGMAPRPGLEPGTYGLTAKDPENIPNNFKWLHRKKVSALRSALKL